MDEMMEGRDRISFDPAEMPHGCIQWQNAVICMDVACACGAECHLDADVAFYVRCPCCKRVYFCNPYIELVELNESEKQGVLDDGFFREMKEKKKH